MQHLFVHFWNMRNSLKMKVVQKPMCVYRDKRERDTHACDASLTFMPVSRQCVYIFIRVYVFYLCVQSQKERSR